MARDGTSTRCGIVGCAGSGRAGVIGAAGLAGGQLLTPPAWTVPHQGQRIGSDFGGGDGGAATTGGAAGGFTSISAGFSATTASGGFAAIGTGGCNGSSWRVSPAGLETVESCRRSSSISRCNASICRDVWLASSSSRRRSPRCRTNAEMAKMGADKTNSANNTARSSKGYPVYT